MRILLFASLIGFSSFGQDTLKLVKHEFSINPIGYNFAKKAAFFQYFGSEHNFRSFYFNTSLNGELLRIINQQISKKSSVRNQASTCVIQANFGFPLIINRREEYSLIPTIGYHYSTIAQRDDFSKEYKTLERLSDSTSIILTGVQIHSLKFALNFRLISPKQKRFVSIHNFGIAYLLGIHKNGLLTKEKNNYFLTIEKSATKFAINKQGLELYYYMSLKFSRFGLNVGVHYSLLPSIQYQPNESIYVPRGGEHIYRSMFQLSTGFCIFNK